MTGESHIKLFRSMLLLTVLDKNLVYMGAHTPTLIGGKSTASKLISGRGALGQTFRCTLS